MTTISQRPNTDVVSILKACASRHPGFDVALLVTLQTEAESLPVDEDAWDDLALENGFEWVDVLEDDYDDELSKSQTDDVSGTRTSQTDRHPDSNSSDLDGVARVIAALHAHMWEVMVPHDRTALPQVDDKRSDGSDNEDEDDLSHLAPPALPVPRPYVAQPVSFPDTFLPSLRVKPSPALAGAGVGAGTAGFADDFAPFEEALHSSHTTFPPLSNENEDEAADHKGLYRHAELSFPDSVSSRSRTVDDDGDEVDVDKGDVEELDDMFEQMMAVRREVEGLGFDERREKAEQAMRSMGLLGAGSRTGSVEVGVDQSD